MTEFEAFYEEIFKPNLAALDNYASGPVFTDGSDIVQASWDRKACFLLYLLATGQEAPLA